LALLALGSPWPCIAAPNFTLPGPDVEPGKSISTHHETSNHDEETKDTEPPVFPWSRGARVAAHLVDASYILHRLGGQCERMALLQTTKCISRAAQVNSSGVIFFRRGSSSRLRLSLRMNEFTMRSGHRTMLFTVLAVLCAGSAAAQETDLSRQTLETMRRHVASLRAVGRSSKDEELPLELDPTPVLRYTDPGGITTDASIWIWGGPGRPAIMAGVFFLTQENREPKWSCELLSLTDGGVAVSSKAGWSWAPDKGDLKWFAIEDAPGDSDRLRLRQMKEIAGRYDVTTSEGTVRSQLRLMVQPLYRYADQRRGLIDGAIFSYAAGTNPEALVLIECRKAEDAATWHAAFARFGANACQAQQREAVVWECPAVQKWDAKEPYFSQFGPVERVFGAVNAK
jgi:hypothetical protein